MTQHFTTDDALYGLRNLAIGDDEQTRIADYENELPSDVRALVDAGDFEGAYETMIRRTLATFTRDEVLTLARVWAVAFEAEDDEADPDSLVADMMNVYDEIAR